MPDITRRARLSTGATGTGSTTASLASYDLMNGQVGLYGSTFRSWYNTSVLTTATVHRFHRVVPSRNMSIIKIGHIVTVVATNDDSVDFGIYNAAGAKIISTGLTAGKANALGVQTVTIAATALTAGAVYYFGHKYGTIGGTAASIASCTYGSIYVPRAFGITAGVMEMVDNPGVAAGDALPANITFQANASSTVPAGLLLES
jgi:hypothetical protein